MYDKVSKGMFPFIKAALETSGLIDYDHFLNQVLELESKLEKSIALNEELIVLYQKEKKLNIYNDSEMLNADLEFLKEEIQQYKDRINKLKGE